MRTFWKWALVLAVPVAWAPTARPADEPARRPGARMVAEEEALELMLLRQKSVREELKIPREDTARIFEFTAKQYEEAQKAHELPEDQRRARFDKLVREDEEFLARHLTPEQRKRLEQISMQLAGLMWVTRPAIARELNLSDEQKQKCRECQKEARDKVMEVIHAENKEGRKEKLAELHKANHDKLMNLLTDQQKAKWKELAGEPFKGEVIFEESESGSNEKPNK
jgi:hypothetical protein